MKAPYWECYAGTNDNVDHNSNNDHDSCEVNCDYDHDKEQW